jgi:hypothetical protein
MENWYHCTQSEVVLLYTEVKVDGRMLKCGNRLGVSRKAVKEVSLEPSLMSVLGESISSRSRPSTGFEHSHQPLWQSCCVPEHLLNSEGHEADHLGMTKPDIPLSSRVP